MILGISASGRPNGITANLVKHILVASGEEFKYISLAGKRVNGCLGCTACAGDNLCVQQDDWDEIAKLMLQADAIIFGSPNYYGMINSLAHACLERTYAFRHQGAFLLAGKLGVVISTGKGRDGADSFAHIERMMHANHMPVVARIKANGYSQCYTCGYGHDCAVGSVVSKHGFLPEIKKEHFPEGLDCQKEALSSATKAGKVLSSILTVRRKNQN